MRMTELIQREPFGELLAESLKRFLNKENRCSEVLWDENHGNISKLKASGYQIWYVNYYTNAIFTANSKKHIFKPLINEFSKSTKWWKSFFQRLYVFASFSETFSGILKHAIVAIRPHLKDWQYILIIPGNHKVRILDFNSNQCYSVMKKGYSSVKISDEIQIRKKMEQHGLSIPAILRTDLDKMIITEEIIIGTPLNRLPSKKQHAYLLQSFEMITLMMQMTKKEISIKKYIKQLSGQIQTALSTCTWKDSCYTQDIKYLADLLFELVEPQSDYPIMLAQSHGDFQPANILCQNGRIWLIDWEYSAERQYGFDHLVYHLQSRAPGNLSKRLIKPLRSLQSQISVKIFEKLLPEELYEKRLQLFLLEELLIRLHENIFPYHTNIDKGLHIFINELKSYLSHYKDFSI